MGRDLITCILIVLMIFTGIMSRSQPLTWTNITTHHGSSNEVYTTIENKFLVTPANNAIVTQCIRCKAQFKGDTLLVTPTETGAVTVTISMAGAPQDMLLMAKAIPELKLMLDGHPEGRIRIPKFSPSQKFIIHWVPAEDNYWHGYQIENFYATAGIGGILNAGANPTRELVEMVKKAPKGTPLTISRVTLVNQENGKREFLKTNFKLVIN